jgi:hypothetical protein
MPEKNYSMDNVLFLANKLRGEYQIRRELVKRIGRETGLSFSTVSSYLFTLGFKMYPNSCGQSEGMINYWNRIYSGEARPNMTNELGGYGLIRKILDNPMWSGELTLSEVNSGNYLVKQGIIKKFKFSHSGQGGSKHKVSRGDRFVFYFPHQKKIVYRMLKDRIPHVLLIRKRSFLGVLGIPYTKINGCYIDLKTNERL